MAHRNPVHITPAQLKAHLDADGVRVVYEKDWDSPHIDPYKSNFKPVGVILHHTAGVNSLAYCMRGSYPPVRNCHFLVDRDGTIHCLAGSGCYHAGEGGALLVNGFVVPKDAGNRHLYGIEIESLGLSESVTDGPRDKKGMTPAQVEAVSKLSASLVTLVNGDEKAVIRHKDWAPGRKIDVRQPLEYWRGQIKRAMTTSLPVVKATEVRRGKSNESARLVKAALTAEGYRGLSRNNRFGLVAVRAYKKWQKKNTVPATGIPDSKSLRILGEKHGFTVI